MGADDAYWDLVYLLYPEAVETTGLAEARELVPGWAALEASLKVRRSPGDAKTWMQNADNPRLGFRQSVSTFLPWLVLVL